MSVNPNFAYLCQGKTRKSASDVAAHRLGQVEAYLTVREVLSEVSTASDGVLSRERSGFCRFGFATLGLSYETKNVEIRDQSLAAFSWCGNKS